MRAGTPDADARNTHERIVPDGAEGKPSLAFRANPSDADETGIRRHGQLGEREVRVSYPWPVYEP